MKQRIHMLLNAVTTNQISSVIPTENNGNGLTLKASIAGTGTVSATVNVYGDNFNQTTQGVLLGTISLTGTTSDSEGLFIPAEWPFFYCELLSISGTGAAVTVSVGM